jgi:hypothetical protein
LVCKNKREDVSPSELLKLTGAIEAVNTLEKQMPTLPELVLQIDAQFQTKKQ